MEKELIIDVRSFMEMFVAVSYLHEQRMFNLEKLFEYIRDSYNPDDTVDFYFEDLYNEACFIVGNLIDEGILSKIEGNLYFIMDKINYKEIILNNQDILPDITEVLYNIYGGKEKRICLVPSKSNQKNNR